MTSPARIYETPAVSDAMDHRGLTPGVVDGLTLLPGGVATAARRARMATIVDSDEPNIPGLAEFLDGASQGDMLVLGWDAGSVSSVWGGLVATRTVARGCVGLVSAGWVRDVTEVSSLPLVVWTAGTTPRSGKGRLAVTRVGAPVTVGGVPVHDRDPTFCQALAGGAGFTSSARKRAQCDRVPRIPTSASSGAAASARCWQHT